jgi:uncharacterized protein (TIGR02118 family)
MIIRSAVFEGTVAEGERARFDAHMESAVLKTVARYPGIRQVKLRRAVETEAGAPPIYMIFDLYFDTLADMHAALASPVRQEVRAQNAVVMAAFTGRIFHLIVDEVATTGPVA